MANDAPVTGTATGTAPALTEILVEERTELRRKLADLGFGDAGGLTYDANFADTSQVTAERGEAEALATELRDSLDEVEAAILRVSEGTYGRCEVCGDQIPALRLEAMPAARRCMTCASLP